MGSNNANYEVKYIELQEKDKLTGSFNPSLLNPRWIIIGRYFSPNSIDAIAQGIEQLRNEGIYPPIPEATTT